MADYFQDSPSFINPSYATPEQLANQRSYADALLKRSGENITRPAGAAANVLDAITAQLLRHNANDTQQQAAQQNSGNIAAMIAQLQGGQKVDPNNLATIIANPMVSPEQRALALKLITPEPTKSEFGQPAYQSPVQGVQSAPINNVRGQPFNPSYRVNQGAEGVHSDAPFPAPGPAPKFDPINPHGGAFGGLGFRPVDGASQPVPQPTGGGGGPAPAGGLPPQPASAIPNRPMTLEELAAKGRDFAAQKTLTQGGASAQAEGNQEDIRSATAAPAIIKGLGLIKSTIQASPDITFGPTAKWSAEVKRVIANYAPGLGDEKSLAGADAIEKLNFGLATQLAKTAGGTQGELFKAIGATPGTEKSKAGTLALIDMIQQDQMKAQQLGGLYRQLEQAGNLQAYPAAREQFLTQHPTINPLTNRPIEMDIKATRDAAATKYEKTATNKATGEKIGLRDGKWEPIK